MSDKLKFVAQLQNLEIVVKRQVQNGLKENLATYRYDTISFMSTHLGYAVLISHKRKRELAGHRIIEIHKQGILHNYLLSHQKNKKL